MSLMRELRSNWYYQLVHEKSPDGVAKLMPSLSRVSTTQEEATIMPTLQTAQDSVVYTLAFSVTDNFV
jgi:hypothetical protein